MNRKDIADIIEKDQWMMKVLKAVKTLNLPDWWIGAGFVRSKIWDSIHGYTKKIENYLIKELQKKNG